MSGSAIVEIAMASSRRDSIVLKKNHPHRENGKKN